MSIKPQLAEDAQLDKLQFPVWEQPKIDGVRAMNLAGTLTGRSLDPFKGFGITGHFSRPEFLGLDGEMTLGNVPNSKERLCSLTTGAMGRFKDVTEMPDLHWWVFDLIAEDTIEKTYQRRYEMLRHYVEGALSGSSRIRLIPYTVVNNMTEAKDAIARNADAGFEGTMFRNPRSIYKAGRSTLEGQLWRVKPWGDFEILITGITEGQRNENEAKKNTLGRTERSSAKAGMVPNGMVGSVQGTLVADVKDHQGNIIFRKGLEITAGSGEMSDVEAVDYLLWPEKIIGHFGKIKHMTFGVKDLPRFPTFASLRMREDM